jgi:hypothetical protein
MIPVGTSDQAVHIWKLALCTQKVGKSKRVTIHQNRRYVGHSVHPLDFENDVIVVSDMSHFGM